MRRLVLAIVLILTLAPSRAEAISVRDIIELSRAGLSDDILLALIEVDGSVFAIDPETLKSLKAAGVSERVIVAMIRSGRARLAEPVQPADVAEPEPSEPPVVVIERPTEVVREVAVPVAVPVYVPVPARSSRGHHVEHHEAAARRGDNPAFKTDTPRKPSKSEPEYWGFGGKLRPDAWKPR